MASIKLLPSILGWLKEPQVKQVNILILLGKRPELKIMSILRSYLG